MKTMKVQPWGKGQGDHVIINESDFNPDFHKPIGESEQPKRGRPPKTETEKKADKSAD